MAIKNLAIILTFVTFCSNGQAVREVYINYETGIAIDLENEKFKIMTNESWPNSCIVIGHELGSGIVKMRSDTITLETSEGLEIILLRESEEIMKSLSFALVPRGQKLYAGTKYFSNGKVKEQGSWDNRKKSGLWMYWNETGEVINKRIYKRGKIKKENYKFRWEK